MPVIVPRAIPGLSADICGTPTRSTTPHMRKATRCCRTAVRPIPFPFHLPRQVTGRTKGIAGGGGGALALGGGLS